MKAFALFVSALMLVSSVSAAAPTSPSICDFYATALQVNQQQLMDTLLGAAVVNITQNAQLVPFFNGQAGPFNFVANATAAGQLIQLLGSFFALPAALNCSVGTVTPYNGEANQTIVHSTMQIGLNTFNLFNTVVGQTAQAFGVNAADLDRVLVILNTFRFDICNSGADCRTPSICDKYSLALFLSNNGLLTVVVDQTVAAALGTSLKRFFDGSIPGTIDFTTNAAALATLKQHLREFFAQGTVLGCTDGSIGAYSGNPNMQVVHAPFPIGIADFNLFNNALIQVLATNGVNQADQDAVLAVLNSTKGDICNQADCGNGAASMSATFFLLLAAFLIALF